MFKRILVVIFSITILAPLTVNAEERSYYYDRIDATITVNFDSTLSVEERQTYNYTGKYTVGWRSISLDKIGAITDVEVFDGATRQKLTKLSKRPVTDTTLPTTDDYGKYTTFKSDGYQNIEWYYDMADTQHTWILKYKVHGTIEFGKDMDRLYYNIFTNYGVPVKDSSINIIMPTNQGLSAYAYRTQIQKIDQSINENQITFSSSNFQPKEAFTIDIAFPKNIITKSAFWKDWLKSNYGYIGSVAITLLAILIALIRWIVTEVSPKGRGTIVPQYSPPQNLPPAMAQIIVKERITPKSWVSTLIDLAVRGYVKIEEEKMRKFNTDIIIIIFGLIFSTVAIIAITNQIKTDAVIVIKLLKIFLLLFIFVTYITRLCAIKKRGLFNSDYIITKTKESAPNDTLRDYEKQYLKTLFSDADMFSTKTMRQTMRTDKSTKIQSNLREAEKLLRNEIDANTDAFERKMGKEKYVGAILAIVFLTVIGSGFIFGKMNEAGLSIQPILLLLTTALCIATLITFFKFEARLSQKGREMKEEWLGFKMYLEVAEKYRMQNLTPDLFEKYLPYAMIFGVEKKWAKNFEAMHLPVPDWYNPAIVAGTANSPSFSPSNFSSSFISSFSSSFSSSGGGGAGGGSAGGGGGGGGGGAR